MLVGITRYEDREYLMGKEADTAALPTRNENTVSSRPTVSLPSLEQMVSEDPTQTISSRIRCENGHQG